jgi:hypothetical protein
MSLKKEENIKQTKLIRKQGASGVLTQKQTRPIVQQGEQTDIEDELDYESEEEFDVLVQTHLSHLISAVDDDDDDNIANAFGHVVGEDSTRWIPSSEARKAAENALAREAASQYFAYQPYSIDDIFDFSERKRPLWDVFWNHGVAALAQQTAAADADARPPPSISTSTAPPGTSDTPIRLD